jgi:phosphoribosylanthranilate isomerase
MFVKICGITSEEDALLAVAMGAHAVGFVFAPSPRQLQPVQAYDIVRRLPAGVMTVGVFRDHAPQRVVDIVNQVGLRAAQLHGHESASDTAYVKARVPFVIKAFPAGSSALERVAEYDIDAVLVDSASPGSGQVFDWALVDGVPLDRRVILAGGLHPGNVADAIEAVRPWGVDVASGVERAPGKKDPIKVRDFIERARAAAARDARERGRRETTAAGSVPYDWQEDEL